MQDFPCSNTLIVGSTGGIGSALVSALLAKRSVSHIYAASRKHMHYDDPRITPLRMDITDETSIASAIASIQGSLDLIIVATGTLHSETTSPEKNSAMLRPSMRPMIMLSTPSAPCW